MNVLKIYFVTAITHGLRMVANLVVLKLIASLLGPVGLGFLGNFMSLTTMASVFTGGGIGNGITKYVAQYQREPIRRVRFIEAAMTYGTVFSLLVLVVSIVGANPLAELFLADSNYAWLMPWLGVAHFFCFIGTASISIANGYQRIDIFAKISISANLITIPVAYLLVIYFSMAGAAVALLLTISCTGLTALYYIGRNPWCRRLRFRATRNDVRKLSRFSIMLMASALFFPAAEIFIRNQIISSLGYEQAGIWQALNRLSGAYLGFFTIFLSAHYMPRLAAITLRQELVTEVRRYLCGVGLAFCGFAVVLYLLRDKFIVLLFSSSFLAMGELVPVQVLGDFFRLMSYVVGFLSVAKAAVGVYVVAELLQATMYMFFSWWSLQQGGGLGQIVYGYVLTYMLYFFVTLVCLQIYLKRRI